MRYKLAALVTLVFIKKIENDGVKYFDLRAIPVESLSFACVIV